MAYLVLGGFIVLVIGAAWLSSRRQRLLGNGCCAPADPRDDLRMRAAFQDDPDHRPSDRHTR